MPPTPETAGHTLDFAILDGGAKEQVVVFARSGSDTAVARIDCGKPLADLLRFGARIQGALLGQAERPTRNEVSDFGRQIFDFCIRDDVKSLYDRLPDTSVRIQLFSDRLDVQALPWEYLQKPRGGSGPDRNRSIVRVVPTIGMAATVPILAGDNVRLLFVAADPIDQDPVSWPSVRAGIEHVFTARMPNRVQITAVPGASVADLSKAIRTGSWDIFHFSGHGEVKDGMGYLLLVDPATQRTRRLRSDDLATALRGSGVRLAVLSACQTSTAIPGNELSVVAATLVRAGIPAVVANQMPVFNSTIATFVGALYDTLLRTGDIDLAVSDGRIALSLELSGQLPDPDFAAIEWGIPTLHRHVDSARIFQ